MMREILAWTVAACSSLLALACWVTVKKFKIMLKDSIAQQVETLKRRWALETELARLKGINVIDAQKTLDDRTAVLNDLLAKLK